MADHVSTHVLERPELETLQMATTGTTAQALSGVAATVLGILGLAGLAPIYLGSVAVIAVGAALLLAGDVTNARLVDLLERAGGGGAMDEEEPGAGLTVELVGGAAGVVLGVLALLDLAPAVLVPAAIIVFGASVLLGGGGARRIATATTRTDVSDDLRVIARQVARTARAEAVGAQVLIGLGAVVLGILALVGFYPAVLSLAALIALGVAAAMSDTTVASRWSSLVRRSH